MFYLQMMISFQEILEINVGPLLRDDPSPVDEDAAGDQGHSAPSEDVD
jgi:hypothetical protein